MPESTLDRWLASSEEHPLVHAVPQHGVAGRAYRSSA
jgi:hypothetical protein